MFMIISLGCYCRRIGVKAIHSTQGVFPFQPRFQVFRVKHDGGHAGVSALVY